MIADTVMINIDFFHILPDHLNSNNFVNFNDIEMGQSAACRSR